MNKDLIAKRFGKSLKTYEDNAKIQRQMAEKLVSFLDKTSYEKILEIGCGTGFLTKTVTEKIKFTSYTANDIVPECETYLKKIHPEIYFVSGDIESCINCSANKYDLIISNASFQWIENLENFLKILVSKLNDGGTLLFSIFGVENFREIYFLQNKKLPYFSLSELKDILNSFSSEVFLEEEIRVLSFSSPKEVLQHIQKTGVNALNEVKWTKKDLKSFEDSYNNLCSGHSTLTYNPIYVKFTK